MQLPGLTYFTLILIPTCYSKGQDWTISINVINRTIYARKGSTVIIPCNFSYPEEHSTPAVKVAWKTRSEEISWKIQEPDKFAFIFHPNDTYVIPRYRDKANLIGDPAKGNCTLKIIDIQENLPDVYMRLYANDQYSFKKDLVHINVAGAKPVTTSPDVGHINPTSEVTKSTVFGETSETSRAMIPAVCVSGAVLLALVVIGGILYLKRRRSQFFAREDSGYYANFNRASSNPTEREMSCKTQDQRLSEVKAIDEPIYINVEAQTCNADQTTDHVDQIYANIDYTK
ncbi:uncharacterized protein KZ484_025977 [Pholidichthys leucotaenia]